MADTVIIGCKLPHGLETQIGGKTVVLRGMNYSTIVDGYGLTYGVDKAGFEEWLKSYADLPYVKNGLVFAQTNEKSAIAQATEQKDIVTGFEGLNQDAPAPGIEPVKE